MTHPKPGDALADHRITSVSAAAMRTMSVVLDDPNPIHLDANAVRELGLGERVINQGPANLGYVIDLVRNNFPGGRLTRFQARLLSNVFDGDIVTAGGAVDTVEHRDDGVHVTAKVWLDIEGSGRAVEGPADVVIA